MDTIGWLGPVAGTAIIVAYTPEGFIIASDGLQHRGEKAIVSQTAQKIYPLTRRGCHLAYAFAGTTKFVQEGRTRLDLYKIVASSVLGSTQDAATFIRELVRMLNRHLQSLRLQKYPDNDGQGTVCEVIILGYFWPSPILARARFFHRQNVLELRPEITVLPLRDEPVWEFLSGPKLIWNLLCDPKDDRLLEYRSPSFARAHSGEILSLAETAKVCSKYIQASGDRGASALDPFCALVGGHTHMAEVTQLNGFRWLIPPVGAS